MKQIILAHGRGTVLVDDEDYERVASHSWCLLRGGGQRKRTYAQANIKRNGKWQRTLLHRFILDAKAGQRVDHRDNNGLNCQRSNMRFATPSQNQHNSGRRIYKGMRSSRFKGVHWAKHVGKWLAQIACDRKRFYLGLFIEEEDAARAYDQKAKELHGEFAKLNFR